jgi:signal transduction histidine kinase
MDPSLALMNLSLEKETQRRRAKERAYVLFQSGGWAFFFGLQTTFALYFGDSHTGEQQLSLIATLAMVAADGLLLTHFARRLIARWGWKQLRWLPLLPRVLGMSLVLSLVWSVVGYGYTHGILHLGVPEKYSLSILFLVSWINGAVILAGWFGAYFLYHISDRFSRSEVDRAQLAASVKEAELRSLKSQINPHFIFNSLNSLRALIDEDPARARQSVTQLANLLRYSLQSGQLETVPFEDELRIVNDYLALEQVRHEERLRVRLDVAPETLSLPIPPMLLQTLVENAVKYGISTQPEGGEIAIVARQENGMLRLQVTNPGSLPTAASTARAKASTGVGLKNAAERLRLLFGERATLELRSASADRVVAEAVIPLRTA